jgi:hypothetical protein
MSRLEGIPEFLEGQERDLLRAVGLIESEKIKRLIRRKALPVLVCSQESSAIDDLLPPGTINLFLTRKNSDFLYRVTESIQQNNLASLLELRDEVLNTLGSGREKSFQTISEELVQQHIICDFRYESKTLIDNIGLVGEMGYLIVPFLWSGGVIHDEMFRLVEYYTESIQEELIGLIVKRPPRLSQAESVAMAQVPPDMLEMNIGSYVPRIMPATLVTATVALTAMTCATWTFVGGDRLLPEDIFSTPNLTEEEIKRLGAVPSVRQLMSLRHELINNRFNRS